MSRLADPCTDAGLVAILGLNMTLNAPDALNLIGTMAWDLRATVEAQLRSLTSLQRCLDEYRERGDAAALTAAAEHLEAFQSRIDVVLETVPQTSAVLAVLRGTVAGGDPV
jgi:hypothetical protein